MAKIIVKQKRSLITENPRSRAIVRALGLRGINHTKTHNDNNCIRGMINKVKHLVEFELVK